MALSDGTAGGGVISISTNILSLTGQTGKYRPPVGNIAR